jgi:hypothetical protein
VRQVLHKRNVRFGTDVVLTYRAMPYINGAIFADYMRGMFISKLNELRHLEPILVFDWCTGPRHPLATSYQADLAELDLSLSEVSTSKAKEKTPLGYDRGTATFLFKRDRAFKPTTIGANSRGAFREAGFEFDMSVGPSCLLFNGATPRETQAWQDMPSLNLLLEQIAVRRRNASLGWTNRPE